MPHKLLAVADVNHNTYKLKTAVALAASELSVVLTLQQHL